MKLFGSFVLLAGKTTHGYNAFVTDEPLCWRLDVCSTYKHKFAAAGHGVPCSNLGLPDTTVHVRTDHSFRVERNPWRVRFDADDPHLAVVEYFDRATTCQSSSHRSRVALHDLPARKVRHRHCRFAYCFEAGVCARSHFDRGDLYCAFCWHRFWTSVH